ncbi:hypothetical protein MRX96_035709 [Rhipicephalus microplus]
MVSSCARPPVPTVAQLKHKSTSTLQFPPTIAPFSFPSSVREGERASAHCFVSSSDRPVSLWWLKDGHPLQPGLLDVKPQLMNEFLSVLYFESIAEEHNGSYTCVASNPYARTNASAQLVVQVPATFITSSMSVTSRKGDKVHLQCDSIGDPPLTITWYRDNVLLDMDRHPRYTLNDHEREDGMASQLLLRDVRTNDTGTYACKVANSHGKDEMFIKLTVQDGTSRVIPIPGTQLEMTLDSLSPNSAYRVEVVAVNGIGTGNPSEPLFFTTDTEAPSAKPVDLKVIPLNATSLRVTWKMLPGDSKIAGYYVGYKAEADGRAESFVYKTVESRPGKTQECDIKDLRPGTKYTVVVQAYNGKGPGPTSDETVGETPTSDIASLFRVTVNYTSSTELRIIWHDVIGPRHGYKLFIRPNISDWEVYKTWKPSGTEAARSATTWVKYRALDDAEWTVVSKEGSKGHVVALNNLERGRRYKLLLGAANSAGYTERLYDMHVAPAASKGVSETSTSAASQQEMHRKLAMVTSIVCSVVVLIVIIVAACVELGRRRRRERTDAAASEIYGVFSEDRIPLSRHAASP